MINKTIPSLSGEITTVYLDSVGTERTVYYYADSREALSITNKGSANLTLTVNGTSYTVLPNQKQPVYTTITNFALVSANGVQPFESRAVNLDNGTINLLSGGRDYGYNLDEGLRNFRNALADTDRNPLKVACVGDSVTWGFFASNPDATSWVGRLRTILQSKLGNVGVGFLPLPTGVAPDGPSSTAWTPAGTWTNYSGSGIGGQFIESTTSGNTLTVTFTGTSCDLIYGTNPNGSTSTTVTIDSVAQTPPSFYSSSTKWSNIKSYTGLSAGTHTLTITSGTGYTEIEGLIAYNPIAGTPKGCYVHRFGRPNARAATFINSSANFSTNIAPHLVILALGINDARNSPTTYYSDMSSIIQTYKNGGASVLLVPYYMINDTTTNNANYINIVNQQYQLADQFGCGLIDIYSRWGKTWANAQVAGLMGGSALDGNSGSDNYHPSDKGHRDIANAIALHLIGQVS